MDRRCGPCHTCCVLPPIEETSKLAGVKCEHARQNRVNGCCNIYRKRPDACDSFNCVWLTSPEMPDEFRPDRSGIMLSVSIESKGKLHIWEDFNSMEESPILEWLKENGVTKHYELVRVMKRKTDDDVPGT